MKRKLLKNIILLILVVFVTLSYGFLSNRIGVLEKQNPLNALRLDTNPFTVQLTDLWPMDEQEQRDFLDRLQAQKLLGTVVDLSGNVLVSNNASIGRTVDVSEFLYMDYSYQRQDQGSTKIGFPIVVEGQTVGFVIYEKSQSDEIDGLSEIKGILTGIFVIILILLMLQFLRDFLKKEISYEELIRGLESITQGILKPLPLPKERELRELVVRYNGLVEELSFDLEQKNLRENERKAFLTLISHELKTPVATINAYVEGLKTGIAKDEETKERYLEIISNKMNYLMNQIDELFLHAQEQTDHFKYNFTEIYADMLFTSIFRGISEQRSNQVLVDNKLPKCLINADPVRIEQVILNLYNNAVKHGSNVKPIELRAYRQDNEIFVEVQDSGEGIGAKELPHIFEPYYQGSRSKIKDYEGAGLGLAICKEITERHGGRIVVRSKLHAGTTMTMILPLI